MEKKAMEKNSNNGKTRRQAGLIATALVTLLIVVTLTTCKPMFLQDIAGYVPVHSQVVGPDGGTVTDSRGASVVIPEGALAEETTITIATYEDGSGIYSRHGVTPFTGGADFGPDGIEFLKPVTITLPSSQKMVPGQTQPLFMQNPATGAWDMTGFTLTAAADGYSATAEVTHFTPYVSSLLPPGALSKIEEFFDGTNGQVALGSYMAWFLTATNLYGYTTECSDSVYEVVGLFFDFTWQVGGVPGTAVSEYGDVSLDTVAQLNYSYDTASTAGPEYIYNMLVTVYFDVTENPPEADPNISILEPVPGSTVEGIETISTYIVTGDSDTDIDSVTFYADGSLLGSDTEAPFQWYWDTDSLADGEHTLTATAAFSSAESLTSEGVTVVAGDEEEEETSPELGSWQSTASFTQERSGHSSVVYDGYIYILGGGGTGNSYYNDVQYAPINSDGTIGTWQSTTPFTQARNSHTSVVHDGYIYVIGGFYSDGSTYYFNDVQYAPINTPPRSRAPRYAPFLVE